MPTKSKRLDFEVGDKWISIVGESSFEVESLNPLVVQVTRRIKDKVETRRREITDTGFWLRTYKKL